MDKELLYDGYISLYKNEQFNTKTAEYKIPVQIKGCYDKDGKEIKKEKIQFPVKLDALENYYGDKGVLYFRVLLTDDRSEIYYNSLYPVNSNFPHRLVHWHLFKCEV